MNSRGKQTHVLMMLLISALFLMVFSTSAFAEEAPRVELPVTIKLSDTPPADDEDYTVIFKADRPDYPMPTGHENGMYHLAFSGTGTVQLPELTFSQRGIYTYTIDQLQGTNELAQYDDTTYNLVVYVTNAEDGSGLATTVLLYMVGETEKLNELVFENAYETAPIIPVQAKKEPKTVEKQEVPQTSDDTVIWPYVGLFISSAAMLIFIGGTGRKRKLES